MNFFGCCLLFGLVSVISSEVVSVCKSVTSSKSLENQKETNCKESFLSYEETQNLKGDVGQKGDKGSIGNTGEKGSKGDAGEVNITEILGLKLELELCEFYEKNV